MGFNLVSIGYIFLYQHFGNSSSCLLYTSHTHTHTHNGHVKCTFLHRLPQNVKPFEATLKFDNKQDLLPPLNATRLRLVWGCHPSPSKHTGLPFRVVLLDSTTSLRLGITFSSSFKTDQFS